MSTDVFSRLIAGSVTLALGMVTLALKSPKLRRANMSVWKFWYWLCTTVVAAFIIVAPYVSSATKERQFDTHDLSGVWWVDDPGPEKLFDRAKNGDAGKCETCHISDHTVPEPPITLWARQHLMTQAKMQGGGMAPNECNPIGTPAQFWYTQLYPFELVAAPGRIFQFFEKQNEWRVIWLNRRHPEDPFPTHMGDSVGKWDGNTLVVDTIGYDGQNLIEPVGVDHRMSSAFHLVERWQRVSANELEVDLTYYDQLAWGSEPWGGLKKRFILQPKMELHQTPCSPEDNRKFDDRFINPGSPPL
jgi:hypothetical protein